MDYDFAEYGEEYILGEMFEIGPSKVGSDIIETQLIFSNLQAAGMAVLKEQARFIDVPLDDMK